MFALLTLLAGLAQAQTVSEVPAGASSVSVLLCERDDGCEAEARALGAHMASLGLPLLDFDALALAGPGGREARTRYLDALDALRRDPDVERALEARQALRELPFTVPMDELFGLQAELGQQLLRAGRGEEAAQAFAEAASCSGGRLYDLPPLSEQALPRYLDATDLAARQARAPVRLDLASGTARGVLFADGLRLGEVPGSFPLAPGWHRLSVESSSRRTAWVGEVRAHPGRDLTVIVDLGPALGEGALEAAAIGTLDGVPPDAASTAALVDWARAHGLTWLRFVAVEPAATARATPAEVFPDLDPEAPPWALRSAWLDVRAGRFAVREPGLAALYAEPRQARFRVGASLGYLFLAPRHHVALDVEALLRLAPAWSLAARLGIVRTGQAYFLYPGWVDPQLYPVALGLRWGRAEGGPYAALEGLAVVPYALGGQLRAGWELAPTTWWRLGIEGSAGLTDKGWLAGGSLRLARRY